jgi:uncharacterized protein (TIGR01370 family)
MWYQSAKFLGGLVLLVMGLLCTFPKISSADQPTLSEAKSFAFAIGVDDIDAALELLKQYDLVIVDGENATAEQVAALQGSDAIVLAYLSVGTIERGRSWFKRVKRYKLDLWGNWGEWYADTSQPKFRRILSGSVAPSILAKGFDGLFLDNVDMIREHRRQRKGMIRLVRALAARVHSSSGYLFAQNGEDVIERMLPSLDGWNREDVTATYNFDTESYEVVSEEDVESNLAAITSIRAQGLVVTATDYVLAGDSATTATAQSNACGVGALSFVSDILLSELPSVPYLCPE